MIIRILRFLAPFVFIGLIGAFIWYLWQYQTGQINIPITEQEEISAGIEVEESIDSFIRVGEQTFFIEIADTDEARKRGLMFRENLPLDRGMLFIFNYSRPYDFWMPNLEFPLDIIWIDENQNVVDVQTVPPCTQKIIQDCPSYTPKGPAKYVLEVNANAFLGQIGDRVEFGF